MLTHILLVRQLRFCMPFTVKTDGPDGYGLVVDRACERQHSHGYGPQIYCRDRIRHGGQPYREPVSPEGIVKRLLRWIVVNDQVRPLW